MTGPINISPSDLRGTGHAVASLMTSAPVPPAPMFDTGADRPQPGREYSTVIVGGLWPKETSANHLRECAGESRAAAAAHDVAADEIVRLADRFGADNSGATAEAAVESHYRRSYVMRDVATFFYDIASAADSHAEILDTAMAAMGQADSQAHNDIAAIKAAAGTDTASRMAAHTEMLGVLTRARGEVEAASDAAVAAIRALGWENIGSDDSYGELKPAVHTTGSEPSVPNLGTAPATPSVSVPAAVSAPSTAAAAPSASVPSPMSAHVDTAAATPAAAAVAALDTPKPVGAASASPLPEMASAGRAAFTAAAITPVPPPVSSPAATQPSPPPAPDAAQPPPSAGLPPSGPMVAAAPPTPTPPAAVPPPAAPAGGPTPPGALPPFGYDRPTFTGAPIPPTPTLPGAPIQPPAPTPPSAVPTVAAAAARRPRRPAANAAPEAQTRSPERAANAADEPVVTDNAAADTDAVVGEPQPTEDQQP